MTATARRSQRLRTEWSAGPPAAPGGVYAGKHSGGEVTGRRRLVNGYGEWSYGSLSQTWLGVSNDAAATVSVGYWYHRSGGRTAAQQARDPAFQDQLMEKLAALTGIWFLWCRRGIKAAETPVAAAIRVAGARAARRMRGSRRALVSATGLW